MEAVLKFLVEQGGFGTIFGLISGLIAYRLWVRINTLQDTSVKTLAETHAALMKAIQQNTDAVTRMQHQWIDFDKNVKVLVTRAEIERAEILKVLERLEALRPR